MEVIEKVNEKVESSKEEVEELEKRTIELIEGDTTDPVVMMGSVDVRQYVDKSTETTQDLLISLIDARLKSQQARA